MRKLRKGREGVTLQNLMRGLVPALSTANLGLSFEKVALKGLLQRTYLDELFGILSVSIEQRGQATIRMMVTFILAFRLPLGIDITGKDYLAQSALLVVRPPI